ncbi:hypothetical protein CBER1_06172 [Cercospora berteroae]|uniref:DUF7582 domain-containing protein n=1 Tax=Cercospora berteroae TaxID=357750 RepID=A0A2S6C4J4_9PEZI|nr:hypothetical protein CBER1_06172 [Cercospora berteroae]
MCHFCLRGRRDLHLEDLAPVPAAARQPGGTQQPEQQQMTRAEIQAHLHAVAKYLHGKRQYLRVVGVGGVIAPLSLGTRNATHDIDIFSDSISPDQANYLRAAVQKVAKKSGLDPHWLNNQTILHIPVDLRGRIQEDAVRQNYILFDEPGLQVVAAPWLYSFTSKLHRISGSGAGPSRQYDPQDAANFLSKYLQAVRRPSITISEVQARMERYKIRITDDSLSIEHWAPSMPRLAAPSSPVAKQCSFLEFHHIGRDLSL